MGVLLGRPLGSRASGASLFCGICRLPLQGLPHLTLLGLEGQRPCWTMWTKVPALMEQGGDTDSFSEAAPS